MEYTRCVNTDFWFGKITQESSLTDDSHHLLQNKFALSWSNAQQVQILLPKLEFLSTFCNNVLQPATTWFVARQVWFMGGKMCNITIQLALQQRCKRVANHCYPFYWTFRSYLLSMFGKGRGEGRGRWAVDQNLMLIPYFSHVNLRMCSASDKRQRQKILPQRTPRNSRNKHNAEEYCHGRCFHLQDTYASVAIKQNYYVIYLGQGENIVRNVLLPVEPLFNPLTPCSDPQPISPKNNTAWSNIQVMRMN